MNTQDLEQLSIPSEQALTRRVVEHVRRHGRLPSLAQLRTMTCDVGTTSALAEHMRHRRPGH